MMVALLRSINLGAGSTVPMAELREVVTALGHGSVRTYIQSGNVVFDSATEQPGPALEAALAARFGFPIPVLVRTAAEMAAIATFPVEDPAHTTVFFLSAAGTGTLDPMRSPPDTFVQNGRELYVRYPNGQGRSKVQLAWVERGLGVVGTARNWRTTQTLADWANGLG